MAVTKPYFLRMFSLFSDYFSPFQVIAAVAVLCFCAYQRYLRVSQVSRYLAMHFRAASCASQQCFWFPGLVPRLASTFSVSISADTLFFQ